VGLGAASNAEDPATLRRASAAAVRALVDADVAAFALPMPNAPGAQAVAEGVVLGAYSFNTYKTKSDLPQPLKKALLLVATNPQMKTAVQTGEITSKAVNFARDLINTPASDLYPAEFVKQGRTAIQSSAVKSPAIKIKIWDEKQLLREKMNAIIDVGKGSQHPPRLMRLEYRPKGSKAHLVLVGKGITFDTGGYSIKPATGMVTMKADMSGAAAVVAAILAVAQMKISTRVTAYAVLAENMVSASAQRPSDVIKSYSGKTIEVLNTDAEGRLVLADAITRALEDKPDVLVDIATLTGAASIALGKRTAGAMARADGPRNRIAKAAERAGEQIWGMPIPEELRASLDSDVADIANISKGSDSAGGMLKGAAFLAEFVPEEIDWVHLDIANVAFNDGSPFGYTPGGGTGFGVRTLVALAEELQASK
jgi:leucyl aminopeptidase